MTKKIRIYIEAMVLAEPHMSGIGHATLEITKELQKMLEGSGDFELQLLVPFNKTKVVLEKFDDTKPQIKKLWLPARITEILMRLRLLPPVDIFLGRGIYIFPNYKNWPVARSRSLTYIHDISFKLYPEYSAPKNRDYLNKYLQYWINRTDTVITLSNQVKSELLEHYNILDSQVEVVYDGVDTAVFTRKPAKEIDLIKQKYSLDINKYLLFVGNKEPRKNLERLVNAFDKLEKELKDNYSLVLVGAGGWLGGSIDEAIQSAINNGATILSPDKFVEDEDLPALYSGAALSVFVPLYEGFGIPPLESLACGTNVLASDIPVLREVLKDQVDYCDPLDINAIQLSLTKLLTNHKPVYKNRSFIQEYSWEKCAAKLMKIIKATN